MYIKVCKAVDHDTDSGKSQEGTKRFEGFILRISKDIYTKGCDQGVIGVELQCNRVLLLK